MPAKFLGKGRYPVFFYFPCVRSFVYKPMSRMHAITKKDLPESFET